MTKPLELNELAKQIGLDNANKVNDLFNKLEHQDEVLPILQVLLESNKALNNEVSLLKKANVAVNAELAKKDAEIINLNKDFDKQNKFVKSLDKALDQLSDIYATKVSEIYQQLNNCSQNIREEYEAKLKQEIVESVDRVCKLSDPSLEENLTQARLSPVPEPFAQSIINEIKLKIDYMNSVHKDLTKKIKQLSLKVLNISSKSEKTRSNKPTQQNSEEQEASLSTVHEIEADKRKRIEDRLDREIPVQSNFRENDELFNNANQNLINGSEAFKKLCGYVNSQKEHLLSLIEKDEDLTQLLVDDSISDAQKNELILDCLDAIAKFIVDKELTTAGDELVVPCVAQKDLEQARRIASINSALAAGSTEFKMFCPSCNDTHLFKITNIKRSNEVLHTGGSNKIESILEPIYNVKCSNCKHVQEISLTETNLSCILSHQGLSQDDLNKINAALGLGNADQALQYSAELINEHEARSCDSSKEEPYRGKARSKNTITKLNCEEYSNNINQAISNNKNVRNVHIKHSNHKLNEIHEHADWQIIPTKEEHVSNRQTLTFIDSNGKEVQIDFDFNTITPSSFNQDTFEASRLFKGCCVSVGLTTLAVALQSLYSPRYSIHNLFFNMCSGSEFLSRQEMNNYFIAAGRLLAPVNEQTKKNILKSTTVLCDETPIKVVTDQGVKQKYVWIVKTGNTEKVQECCIQYCGTRSAESGLTMFDMFSDEECSFKNLLTDGYIGYDTMLSNYSKSDKREPINHCDCNSHFRRTEYEYMESSGLLVIYKELLGASERLSSFPKKLREYTQNHDLSPNNLAIMVCYYLTNVIFANDASVTDKYTDCSSQEYIDELNNVRQSKSIYIVTLLNKIMEFLSYCQRLVVPSKGNKTYVINKLPFTSVSLAKSVLYWMKDRVALSQFIHDARIECSTNSVERSLRATVIAKRASMTFNSSAGTSSFANIMTTIQNCQLAKVSIFEYMSWYIANMRHRAFQIANTPELCEYVNSINKDVRMLSGDTSFDFRKAFFTMPRSKEIKELRYNKKNKKVTEKITVDCYDKRNTSSAWLSYIPTQGLTVKDFALLKQQGL